MTSALRGLEFQSPSRFVFGFGASAGLASEVRALGGTKALVVTKKSMVDRGDVAPALRSLDQGRVPYAVYDGILPDAPVGLIDDALGLLRSSGCDLVIGLGGGSAMDIAKCVAVAATNEVPVRQMLGHGRVPRRGLPKIVVSTTHVAGADTGSAAVLQIDEQTHEHGVVDSPYLLPDVVINDPELTLTMTPEATVDTCLDTLVTGIECLTGRQANPLSDLYSESIVRICARYLPAVVADGRDREARANLALAASMGGWAYMSSFIGAVHGISYGVAAVCQLTHGRSMAAILPAVMRYNLAADPAAFRRLADLLGSRTADMRENEAAALSVVAVEQLLDGIGVAHRLRDYGLQREQVGAVADLSWGQIDDFLESNARPFGRQDVVDILEGAF
jgi:alcohol dehydrogenase class IV